MLNQLGWFDVSACEESMHIIARNDEGKLALFHVDETECKNCEHKLTELGE